MSPHDYPDPVYELGLEPLGCDRCGADLDPDDEHLDCPADSCPVGDGCSMCGT